jgi:hypothetical protein
MRKRLFALLTLCMLTLTGLLVCPATAQNQIFEKYSNLDGVEYICLTKWMLRHLKSTDNSVTINGVKLQGLSNAIEVILIINSDNAKAGAQMKEDFNALKSDPDYNVMMVVKDNNTHVSTLLNDKNPVKEFVMYIDEGNEQTFIVLTGKLTDEMIQKLLAQ